MGIAVDREGPAVSSGRAGLPLICRAEERLVENLRLLEQTGLRQPLEAQLQSLMAC
jgi:hypothetical protein